MLRSVNYNNQLSKFYFKKAKVAFPYKYKRPSKTLNLPSEIATEYFDSIYGSYFGKQWPSIRLALFSIPKYSLLYNNYSHNQTTILNLKEESDGSLKSIWDILDLPNEFSVKLTNQSDKDIEELDIQDDNKNQVKKFNTIQHKKIKLDDHSVDTYGFNSLDEEKLSRLVDFSHIPAQELVDLEKERYDYNAEIDNNRSLLSTDIEELEIFPEKSIYIPKNIQFYFYDKNENIQNNIYKPFPPSPMTNKGLIEYYIMDASSIIPVLALEIRPKNDILDMCAAPGGKALAAIQTLNFETITCIEKSTSRYNRLCKVFETYLPKGQKFRSRIKTINADAMHEKSFRNSFDRVLVDVPCTSDRKSVKSDDDNIFHKNRFKERALLPQIQTDLLVEGIRNLKPGGKLVYSTCTLSPSQNDAIIRSAYYSLSRLEPDIKIRVIDCSTLCQLLQTNFSFYKPNSASPQNCLVDHLNPDNDNSNINSSKENKKNLGHLIIPSLDMNWGPLYFCKIERIK
ncbi:unnamed protein product [Gordionus sp. m RMFG-2023]|uniref:5-methylcytosine rRNA methyltransferase NSUN4-like isoform X2 n=1 Tax=Gordionus sp. m RMFG-2023 TaxID=3053472 RepID=UPI0030E5CC2B